MFSAERRLDAVALLVQLEALILLLSPALALIVRQDAADPRPALFALVFAPILWRLGIGVAHASRVALTILALLVLLHLFVAVATAGLVDLVVASIEAAAIGVAVFALKNGGPAVDPSWRSMLNGSTVISIALALIWPLVSASLAASSGAQGDAMPRGPLFILSLFLIATAIVLAWRTALIGRLQRQFRTGVTPPEPGDVVAVVDAAGELLSDWREPPRSDFVYALAIGGVSIYSLTLMERATSGPDVMLVPGVLIFPLAAIFGVAVGIAWVVSAIAHITERSWAATARQLATVGSMAILMTAAAYALMLLDGMISRR